MSHRQLTQSFSLSKRTAIVACVFLCSCASLKPTPTNYLASVSAAPSMCGGVAVGSRDERTCDALETVREMEGIFRGGANQASKVDAFFGYQQIGSALALAGFTLFDAHADNIKAATLLGGIGAVGSSQLKPAARTKIFIDSTQALMCVHSIGSRFLTAQSLDGTISTSVNELRNGRETVALLEGLDPEMAAKASKALDDLESQLEVSSETDEARNGVSYKINDMVLTIDSTVERLLQASAPDIAEIVEAVTNLGGVQDTAAVVDAASTQDAGDLAILKALQKDGATIELRLVAGTALSTSIALKQASRGPGVADIERIGKCIKSFD